MADIDNHNHDGINSVQIDGTSLRGAPTSAMTTQLTTISTSSPSVPDYAPSTTNSTAWGLSSDDEMKTLLTVIANLQVRVQELEDKLQSIGLIL